MMRMRRVARLVGLLATLSLVGRADADSNRAEAPVALKGLDPVSLTEGKEVPGNPELTATRGRFRYLFANAEHEARFEADPGRYAIQGDGNCTVMPSVPASPGLFLVHDGRIYLFGSPACRDHFQADPATFLKPRKKVAIFVYEGVELLDFAGPGEVFTMADRGRAFHVYTVAVTSGPIISQGFVSITPRYTIANCPKPDVLVLPGGATRIPLGDPAVIGWIRDSSRGAGVVISVCTGAFLLADAGLLDGQEATTHWGSIDRLKQAAPMATVREGVRFVDNGKFVTSAGVSAGIDASLHVVGRLLGHDAATDTARYMDYKGDSDAQSPSR